MGFCHQDPLRGSTLGPHHRNILCPTPRVSSHYGRPIFALWFLSSYYLLSFFNSPNLSGRRLDVYHTSTHGVALVRI